MARHAVRSGRRARAIDPQPFEGLVGRAFQAGSPTVESVGTSPLALALTEYEALVGGSFWCTPITNGLWPCSRA